MVADRALRMLSIVVPIIAGTVVAVTFGLMPPELGARLSELLRGDSSPRGGETIDEE